MNTEIECECEYCGKVFPHEDMEGTYELDDNGKEIQEMIFLCRECIIEKDEQEEEDDEISEYWCKLVECNICKNQTKRIDLKWNEGSYIDICLKCTK